MKKFAQAAALNIASALFLVSQALAAEPNIPAYTPALAARLEKHPFPLTAIYGSGRSILVFAAGGHVFSPDNSRIKSISAAFQSTKPEIVIVEGFPTRMGENPPPLVAEARNRNNPGADAYARGEAMFAASLALDHHIQFIGGEPTEVESAAAIAGAGYAKSDISFAYLVRALEQSIRGGELTGATDPNFSAVFERYSQADARDLHGQMMSLAEFAGRYRSTFGVEYFHDPLIAKRADPGANTRVGKMLQLEMVVRDQHIFSVIMQELAAHKRVLIVYGGSHWTTLSQALEQRLGKPTFL